jgi:hypothetical protein
MNEVYSTTFPHEKVGGDTLRRCLRNYVMILSDPVKGPTTFSGEKSCVGRAHFHSETVYCAVPWNKAFMSL